GPAQAIQRVVREPVELYGRTLEVGQHVHGLIGAANHDPRRFEAPNELDLKRPNSSQHLGFGHGIHYCLGALLARLEASVTIGTLLRRFPGLRLVDDFVPTWSDSATLQRRPVSRG